MYCIKVLERKMTERKISLTMPTTMTVLRTMLFSDSAYKSTNNFLHELHTLQRHRLSFSPSQGYPNPFSPRHGSPYDFNQQPSKGMPDAAPSSMHAPAFASDIGKQHEFDSVREHYEEMNRLLGSVVLCRRRELDPEPGNNST